VISVTGAGSGTSPYTIGANICNGLAAINDPSRDVLDTDKAVVIDGAGACQLVTIPTDCIPLGGTTHQVLLKNSDADCDLAWTTVPYAMVSNGLLYEPLVSNVPYLVEYSTADTDPYSMFDILSPTVLTLPWAGWWTFGFSASIDSYTEDASTNHGKVDFSISGGVLPGTFYGPTINLGTYAVTAETLYATGTTSNYFNTAGATIFLYVAYIEYGTNTGTVALQSPNMWANWIAP
jgi:hypothetical protein